MLVMPFNSRRHFRTTHPPGDRAGPGHGGPLGGDAFEIVVEVIVAYRSWRHRGELAAAARGVRSLLSFYGSTPNYRPVLDVEGME